MWMNSRERYGTLAMVLHWVTVGVLLAVILLMELRGMFPKGSSPREAMKEWHYVLGVLVFPLTALRVLVRLSGPVPAIIPALPEWQHALARLVHWSMYIGLLAMPLVGWGLLSAGGEPLPLFGAFLPPLVGADEMLAGQLEEAHELGAKLVYLLLGLHVAAALHHHFLLRDNTLRRLWPRD
jgi:cytochrome b561